MSKFFPTPRRNHLIHSSIASPKKSMAGLGEESTTRGKPTRQSSTSLPTTGIPSNIPNPTSFPSAFSLDSGYIPENPFLPKWPWQAPLFLDTAACVCALRESPDNSTSQAWQCRGNATTDPNTSVSGKWFNAPNVGNSSTALEDASSPPDTRSPLVASEDSTLTPLASVNPNPLSLFDQDCTGINQTNFTTSYYQASRESAQGQPPIAAVPCLRPGAIPITLTLASAWQNETIFIGCKEGFFCP